MMVDMLRGNPKGKRWSSNRGHVRFRGAYSEFLTWGGVTMKVSSFAVMITVEEGVLLLSRNFVEEKIYYWDLLHSI